MKITYKDVVADVWYDDSDERNKGWYATYTDDEGDVIDDSVKVWHPEMPRRRDARAKAHKIVRAYLRTLTSASSARP